MHSLHCQLLWCGSLPVARELASTNLLVVCQNTYFTVTKHTPGFSQPLVINKNLFLDMTYLLVSPWQKL
jgi:hypothetical protein